jgi:3-hydroxyanthranilate 3,4-dioxygenase
MRPEGTVGLIVERVRKGELLDTHRWYCENCNNVLFEKTAHIEVLERDMPPIFEAYYSNPQNQVCKACGNVNAGRPARK